MSPPRGFRPMISNDEVKKSNRNSLVGIIVVLCISVAIIIIGIILSFLHIMLISNPISNPLNLPDPLLYTGLTDEQIKHDWVKISNDRDMWFAVNSTVWKMEGYYVKNNMTANYYVGDQQEKQSMIDVEKSKESIIQYDMKLYNMTRNQVIMTFEFTGERPLPYYYDYTSTNGLECQYFRNTNNNNYLQESVRCNDPANYIQETKLSKVVKLEFNKEYYAEGMNMIQELIGEGYSHPSMTEIPSTTWDGNPTSKYIVILENHN